MTRKTSSVVGPYPEVAREGIRMTVRFLNISLRGLTLGSRFILMFCLAKYLPVNEVGEYGILFATISYVLFILGLDFYTYSTRELIGSSRKDWPRLLKSQGVFVVACYAITLPVVAIVLYESNALPEETIGWFFLLLVLEHLGQEINRLLVAMSRPLLASFVLFVRSGAWVIFGAIAMILTPHARALSSIFAMWACGGTAALVVGAFAFSQLDWSAGGGNVDWSWIWRGVKVAVPLLIATLAIRLLFAGDRYLERFAAGDEILGAYTFYVGVAGSLLGFLDAAVISFVSPRLVAAVRANDVTVTTQIFKQFARSTIALVTVFIVVCAVIIEPILMLIGKPIYRAHLSMFFLLLIGSGMFCLSMVPHYGLYAHQEDRAIIVANGAGCIVFFISFFLLISTLAELAVPVALLCAFSFICVTKYLIYRKLRSLQLSMLV